MVNLLEIRAQTATQNLLVFHKVSTLQLNLNTEVFSLESNNSNINIFCLKSKQHACHRFPTIDINFKIMKCLC